jgi:hypothetical protein
VTVTWVMQFQYIAARKSFVQLQVVCCVKQTLMSVTANRVRMEHIVLMVPVVTPAPVLMAMKVTIVKQVRCVCVNTGNIRTHLVFAFKKSCDFGVRQAI